MGQQTPLYSQHLAAHAKIVDFGGWDMPLHYGSQVQEHHQVRTHAGLFDVSHMTVVDAHGPGARDFLRYALANDVARLTVPGKALYSCMLNAQGGVVDDLIVYFWTPEHYRLVVNAATRAKDLAWLNHLTAGFAVTLAERDDLAMLAVQGPHARERAVPLLPTALHAPALVLPPFHACQDGDWMVARTGYTGEDGFEILLPASQAAQTWEALLAAGIAPAGLGARDTLRLEAGMALYGHEMDETTRPDEAGLAWTVAWTPQRDFVGRVALAAQPAAYQQVGILLAGQGVLRQGQTLWHNGALAGQITSGGFAPTLNASIALARVATQHTAVSAVAAHGWEVEIRGSAQRCRRLSVQRVKPPFARHGGSCYTQLPAAE